MDVFTKSKRSEIMALIKNKESGIEILLRKELWGRGLRYRKNVSKYFGKPDIVSAKHRMVIFVDSCFWHGCKKHKSIPHANKMFWEQKIQQNSQRDKEVKAYYQRIGWKIFRIWEHDLKGNNQKFNNSILKIFNHVNLH